MKRLLIYVILILVSFTSCQKQKNEVIVKGKFIGEIPEELIYSIPVNGICYDWFNSTTEIDSTGNFEFKIQTETPCFITLFLTGNRGNLIVLPGESYNVTIKSKEYENQFQFECDNVKLQEEYQKLESPFHPQFGVARELQNNSISEVENRIDSLLNVEIKNFEELSQKNILSNELFELIKIDRTLYYSCVQGQVAMMRYYSVISNNQDTKADSIKQMWKETTLQVDLNTIGLLKSKWAYYYIQNYLLYREYMEDGFNRDARSKARNEEKFHTYIVDIAKKYLTANVLEFYEAAYILSSAKQKKFEKELITLFDEFITDFPKSTYIPFLKPQIEKIIEFQKKAESGFDEEVTFIDNYENINSLEECLKLFKGQRVYVDIWATTCGPCTKEFAFNENLRNLLKSNNIEILYISTDRIEEDKRWKDMIKYYQLQGNHLRANEDFKADLRKLLGRFGIPRYLLINEKGEIINDDAERPSELKALEKQIEEK